MEHVMLTKLREAGCDMDGTLERFMNNEMLCMKFLRKFPEDTTFGGDAEGLCAGRCGRVFLKLPIP